MTTTLNTGCVSSKAHYQAKELKHSCARARGHAPTTRSATLSIVATSAKHEAVELSRRAVTTTSLAALSASLFPARSAHAFLGFDTRPAAEIYTDDTTKAIEAIKNTIYLARDDPTRDDQIKKLKKVANNWVATYRRDPSVSGRPSYGYVYSVVNAVEGHYNNFGTKAPIPKKRMARIDKELEDATLALSRNR